MRRHEHRCRQTHLMDGFSFCKIIHIPQIAWHGPCKFYRNKTLIKTICASIISVNLCIVSITTQQRRFSCYCQSFGALPLNYVDTSVTFSVSPIATATIRLQFRDETFTVTSIYYTTITVAHKRPSNPYLLNELA